MSRFGACALGIFLVSGPTSAQDIESWTLVEEMRIGAIDRPNYAFTMISSIEVAPDGRILVSQPFDENVRVFDEQGGYLYTIGRAGDGPGELRGTGSLRYSDERLSIVDMTRQRLHEFMLDGTYIKSWAPPDHRLANDLFMRAPSARLRDGSLIVVPSYVAAREQQTRSIPILQFDTTGALLRTLAHLSVGSEGRRTRVGNLGAVIPQPVSSNSLWTPTHDGSAILVIHRTLGDADSPGVVRLLRIETSGDTTVTREYRVPAVRIDMSGVEDSIQKIAERTNRLRGFPRGQIAEMYRTGWKLPEFQSPIERVVAGIDGSIWVQHGAFLEREVVWWILDRSGDVIAEVTIPAELKLMCVSDNHAWSIQAGEYGELYVVRLRIVGRDELRDQER